MKQHIVFDLDGTLVESLPGIAEGVARALQRMGRPAPSPQQVRGMIGQGARHLCAQALGYASVEDAPADLLGEMYQRFCCEYPLCWQGSGTVPYAGVQPLLETLAARGARLAVLSNKPHEVTLPMVQQLFPAVPFEPILGYTGQFPRKPSPAALLHIAQQWGISPAELTLVGDSIYDACTAQAAGSGLVLVSWGYADTASLRKLAAPMARSIPDLAALLGA